MDTKGKVLFALLCSAALVTTVMAVHRRGQTADETRPAPQLNQAQLAALHEAPPAPPVQVQPAPPEVKPAEPAQPEEEETRPEDGNGS